MVFRNQRQTFVKSVDEMEKMHPRIIEYDIENLYDSVCKDNLLQYAYNCFKRYIP